MDEKQCELSAEGSASGIDLKKISTRAMTKPIGLLDIAKDIQSYIDGKGWSWCDMDRVYRILKTVNG